MDTHSHADQYDRATRISSEKKTPGYKIELIQPALDRCAVERRARLVNQPMGSNFDGNCGSS